MRRVFGARKKKEPAPSLEDTTSSLNSRGENIDEKIRKLEGELSRFRDQLKRVKGPAQAAIKQRALRVLKQKRMYEQQRDQLYNQSFNLEQVSFATQNIKDTISGTLTWRPKLTGSDLNITQYFVSSEGTRMKVGTSPVSRRAWTDQFSFFAYNADTHPGTIRYYVSEAAGPRHRISTTSIQGAA